MSAKVDESAIRVNKIKYSQSSNRLFIGFERLSDKDWDICTVESADQPTEQLEAAMQQMLFHGLVICELPKGYGESARVSGISFSYAKDGVMGVIITIVKDLQGTKGVLVLNTPLKPVRAHGEGEDTNVLNEDAVKAVTVLMDEIKNFLNGKRKQLQLL